MNVKKLTGLIVIALVVFFIVTNPSRASGSINGVGNWLYGVGTNITNFLASLAP